MSAENADSGLENESFRSSSEGYESEESGPEEVSFGGGAQQAREARAAAGEAARRSRQRERERRRQREELARRQKEAARQRRMQNLQDKRLPDAFLQEVAAQEDEEEAPADEEEEARGHERAPPAAKKGRFQVVTPGRLRHTHLTQAQRAQQAKEEMLFRPQNRRVSARKVSAAAAKRAASGRNVFAS